MSRQLKLVSQLRTISSSSSSIAPFYHISTLSTHTISSVPSSSFSSLSSVTSSSSSSSHTSSHALVDHSSIRSLHTSTPRESTFALACFGLAVAAVGGHRVYQQLKAPRPKPGSAEAAQAIAARNHYEGGFEEKMTKKEAALILGVKESASREKIMERYRVLMKVNHPDLGGSPYLSSKVNEAKDFIYKTAKSEAADPNKKK